jgi:hypothetical protein
MAFKGAAGMTDRYIKKLPNRAAKKPRYKPLPARRRKKLKTVHQTGGVLEIGSLGSIQPPERAFQRFPIGTPLFRKKWSRFDEINVRYYLYEDHFLMYLLDEWEDGARVYRSHVRNIEKYTTEEELRGLPPVYKRKKIVYRPDMGKQAKLF